MSEQTWDPGFPVYIYRDGLELPDHGTYYLVSGNGIWLHKDTGLVHGFVRVDNVSILDDLNAHQKVGCRIPKLPLMHVWKIKEFFRRVVEKHHAEAGTILYYSKANNDFRVVVPEQLVSHGGVSYRRESLIDVEGMESYLRVGTIHSHCDFGAFHSGTDIGDEEDFDGLHVTFGHNDKDIFSITASVVMNGCRLSVDPLTVLEGIECMAPADPSNHRDGLYGLPPVEEATVAEWSPDIDLWMTNVTGRSYVSYAFSNFWKQAADPNAIKKGDRVTWSDKINSEALKAVQGDGPFEVHDVSGVKVVIVTPSGKARFHENLLKKVQD